MHDITTPYRQSADDPIGSMPDTSSTSYAHRSRILSAFDHFASRVTRWAGTPLAFCMALLTVLVWALAGPLFHFSENWQLVINTGTTIAMFLMVFLIQQSQSKDSVALHLKLNELLAASKVASKRMIGPGRAGSAGGRGVLCAVGRTCAQHRGLQGAPFHRRTGLSRAVPRRPAAGCGDSGAAAA